MANREKGESQITIDGTVYRLRLSLNACCALEDLLSTPEKEVSIGDVFAALKRKRANAQRQILWAALHDAQPALTLEDVGRLCDQAGGPDALMLALAGIVETASPDEADLAELGTENSNGRPREARAS